MPSVARSAATYHRILRELATGMAFPVLAALMSTCGGSTSPPAPSVAITVSPGSASVQAGATQQFTATVTGTSNTSVTWSVNSVPGGNSTVGTISATGLYTGPSTVPSSNTVTVTATSVADTTKSASAAVSITAASSELQISSLSETTANPFDSLTITGAGFSQGTLAISVLFIPKNGDAPVMIPVSASDSTSVQVLVPTFTGLASGTFTAETVDVQVVEFSDSTTYLSNRITGLNVNALASVPSGVPVGALTAALLTSAMNISGTTLTAQRGNTTFSGTAAALIQLNGDLGPLVSAINTIMRNPAQSVALTMANGTTTTLDAQTVALSDQLAQALMAAIVNQGSIPTATSPSNCPATGNTAYDTNLCSVQTYFETLASQASATTAHRSSKLATRLEITPPERAVLTLYANITLGGLAGLLEPAGGSVIYGFVVAPVVTNVISALAVNQETPPGADIAAGVGLNFLDQAFFAGVPVLGTAVDEIRAIQTIITWSPPQKGILLSSGAAGFLPGGVTFLDPNTGAPTTLLRLPVQTQGGTFDSTTLVVPPQPAPFMLTLDITGGGSGSISSFPSGISFPAGTIVRLTEVPATGSTFAGWGGACSGTGTCAVTMNHNQILTADFEPAVGVFTLTITEIGTGSGTVTPNPSGLTYAAGTVVTLTATPASGSVFAGWTGACTGTGTCAVTMNQNQTVTADFERAPFGGAGLALQIPSQQVFSGCVDIATGRTNIDTTTLVAFGGVVASGYTWTVTAGTTLPAGVGFLPFGFITGNGGTASPGNSTFSMTVNDDTGTQAAGMFTMSISQGNSSTKPPTPCGAAVPSLQSPSNLPDATNSKPYAAQIHLTGVTLPVTWSLASGNLPASGLVLDQARGVVRGTPPASAAGQSFTFTIQVTDSANPPNIVGGGPYTLNVH